MSDEYSIGNRFLAGEISAEWYWWKMGVLAEREEEREYMPHALCANPDCGAFFDEEPVPHLDRETRVVVLMCVACTKHFAQKWDSRYIEIDRVDEKGPSRED